MGRILLVLTAIIFLALPQSVMAEEAPPPLVSAAWLASSLDREGLVILDIRGRMARIDEKAYQETHIPGAVYSGYDRDAWRVNQGSVPGMLPSVAHLERMIGALGIEATNHVVLVAAGLSALEVASATRIYWTFKVLGHEQISILNGGMRAYLANPLHPTERGWNAPQTKIYKANPRPELVAGRGEVAEIMRGSDASAGTRLVDSRPPAFYRGKKKAGFVARAGTIPGAINIPERHLLSPDGTFPSVEQLAELSRASGLADDQASVAFCNSGHWASLGWFVRHELQGNEMTKLYDGSMVDWAAQEDLPVVPGGQSD